MAHLRRRIIKGRFASAQVRGIGRAGREQHQFGRITGTDWQIDHAAPIDHLGELDGDVAETWQKKRNRENPGVVGARLESHWSAC